jgi:hypothetical protein
LIWITLAPNGLLAEPVSKPNTLGEALANQAADERKMIDDLGIRFANDGHSITIENIQAEFDKEDSSKTRINVFAVVGVKSWVEPTIQNIAPILGGAPAFKAHFVSSHIRTLLLTNRPTVAQYVHEAITRRYLTAIANLADGGTLICQPFRRLREHVIFNDDGEVIMSDPMRYHFVITMPTTELRKVEAINIVYSTSDTVTFLHKLSKAFTQKEREQAGLTGAIEDGPLARIDDLEDRLDRWGTYDLRKSLYKAKEFMDPTKESELTARLSGKLREAILDLSKVLERNRNVLTNLLIESFSTCTAKGSFLEEKS